MYSGIRVCLNTTTSFVTKKGVPPAETRDLAGRTSVGAWLSTRVALDKKMAILALRSRNQT